MKFLLYSDNHWCQYSSIMRDRGEKFSLRLENQIKSLNWVMQLAEELGCTATFCLGDFFDKAELNAEELSALKEIKWANMYNFFIAGNHEMAAVDHKYSSAKLFNILNTGKVLTKPEKIFDVDNVEIYVLPYILESERKDLIEYIPKADINKKRFILSHNDIAGIQLGKFISEAGFSINEIELNCDYFINGHLHNGTKISDKIINIGNLTGQNFSEDASKYDHGVILIDTENPALIGFYENPYAFNFYKLDIVNKKFPTFKDNSIVSFKCKESFVEELKNYIEKTPAIIKHRITIEPELLNKDTTEFNTEDLTVDHLARFKDYIHEKLGDSSIVNYEIGEICK